MSDVAEVKRAAVAVELLPELKKAAKERQRQSQGRGQKGVVKMPDLLDDAGKSRDQAAALVGVSARYVSDAQKVKTESPQIFQDVRDGKVTITEAKRAAREGKREGKRRANAAKAKGTTPIESLDGVFSTLLVDPPWSWDDEGDVNQLGRAKPDYGTMTIDQLAVLPVSKHADGWANVGMPEPRPLYRLPTLADAERVFVTEGEKAADAARSVGLIATTSPHGSDSPHKADWQPLAGKDVVLLPDADKAGAEYRDAVGALLTKLNPPATVRVLTLPGLPPAGDIADWLEQFDAVEPETLRERIEAMADEAAEWKPTAKDRPRFATELYTGSELLALDLSTDYHVDQVVPKGQPGSGGGRVKVMKTSVAIDLVLSLGSGTKFLGMFDSERVNVGFWSGESGAATIRETAKRIAESKGIDLAKASVLWSFELPKLGQFDHVAALGDVIEQHKLAMVVIDPLYLSLLSAKTASGASNVFQMGATLAPLSELAQRTGATVLVLHHFRKNSPTDDDEPAGLSELAQSGVAEWSRWWILLQRRAPYQHDGNHELWMRTGGSAGHAGLWGVDVAEGVLPNRYWDVSVRPIADTREEARQAAERRKADALQRKEDDQRQRLHTALRQFPEGETARTLRLAAGLNPDGFGKAVYAMLARGEVAACQIEKTGRHYEGFILTPEGRK